MKLILPAFAVGEQYFTGFVVDDRVPDRPLRIIDKHGHLAGGQVEFTKLPAAAECLSGIVVGVVTEIGLPVAVVAGILNRT